LAAIWLPREGGEGWFDFTGWTFVYGT
jgi:hypothetical protein